MAFDGPSQPTAPRPEPAAPVHPQPVYPQPAYQQPGYPAPASPQPGYLPPTAPDVPATGGATAPGAPTPVALALGTLRTMLLHLWRGQPVESLRLAAEQTARGMLLWWCVLLANGLLAGLLVASFVVKAAQGAASVTNSLLDPLTGGYGSSYVDDAFSVPFSALAGVTLTVAFVVVACLVLRTVTVSWTFRARGAGGRFRDSAAVVATSASATPLLLAAAWVVSWIPGAGGSTLSVLVLSLGGFVLLVVSEGIVYIGLNRTVRFAKSPLLPHAALTLAFAVLATLTTIVVNTVVLASLIV